MGPLNSQDAVQAYLDAIARAKASGGKVETGGSAIDRAGNFVLPAMVTGLSNDAEVVQTETFAPILYVMKYRDLRSEEHTSELQSLMRNSYAVFCLKKKTTQIKQSTGVATSLHTSNNK